MNAHPSEGLILAAGRETPGLNGSLRLCMNAVFAPDVCLIARNQENGIVGAAHCRPQIGLTMRFLKVGGQSLGEAEVPPGLEGIKHSCLDAHGS